MVKKEDYRMKRIAFLLGFLVLIGFSTAEGAEWQYFWESATIGKYYIFRDSLIMAGTKPSNQPIQIWIKIILSEKGKKEAGGADFVVCLWEIDCVNKRYRTPYITRYAFKTPNTVDDTTLKISSAMKWQSIDPRTASEYVCNVIAAVR